MPETQTSPEPTSVEEVASVDFAGLVDALGLTAEQRAVLSNNEGEVEIPEAGDVPVEEETVVEVEGEENQPTVAEDVTETVEAKDLTEGKLPESVQRRIDKLTAEKYNLAEENAQLKSRLAEQKAPVVPNNPDDPLANVNSPNDLAQYHEWALMAKEFALRNPEGGTYLTQEKDGTQKEVVLDQSQVRELHIKANRLLEKDIPKKRQYLAESQGHFAEARKVYPQLFDNKHPDAQMAANLVRLAPWIKQFPDWPMLVGHTVRGLRGYLADKAAGTKAPVKGIVAPVAKPKVIGSPKGQSGPKTKAVRSVSEYASASKDNSLSVHQAADLLDSFISNKF